MTSATPVPARSDAPWDLSFLRTGALVTGVLAAAGAVVVGLIGGWADALGVVLAAVVVTAFFAVSGVAVAWAGRIGDTLTLPAALLAFLVKAVVLFGVLESLPADGWLDRRTFAWSVVVGALLWSGVQLRWVWTRPLYYVPPPAPPAPPAEPAGGALGKDPERPAEGG